MANACNESLSVNMFFTASKVSCEAKASKPAPIIVLSDVFNMRAQ
jgi:hypothetical protein